MTLYLSRSAREADYILAHEEQERLRQARLLNERSSSHQTFKLSDGRVLGYATYGVPTGPTFFFLHGFADCRLTCAILDEPAKSLGIRLISVDRPGCGISSIHAGRSALDFVQDLRQLATHLNVSTYGVIGVSGAGPYLLACAYALPKEQLKSLSLLCATGPWNITRHHLRWPTWAFWQVTRLSPTLVRWQAQRSVTKYRNMPAEKFIASTKAGVQGRFVRLMGMPASDVALLQNEDFLAIVFQGLKENCSRDVDGMLEEWQILTQSDMGFKLESIRGDLPIQLWYGKKDNNVPWRIGDALRRCIGGKAKLYLVDETHLGILVNCKSEVLEEALSSW